MNWIKFLTDKNVSKTPLMMDIRWVFCNHMTRQIGGVNDWKREKWQKYLIEGKWSAYSILDMIRIFFTSECTRESIIDCLKAPQDERYLD